jgi:hypothetical protein
MARLDALFTTKKPRVEFVRLKRSVATIDVLHEIIIVFIEAVQDVGGEVLGAKRMVEEPMTYTDSTYI